MSSSADHLLHMVSAGRKDCWEVQNDLLMHVQTVLTTGWEFRLRLCGPYMTLFMWMLRHLHSLVAGFQEGGSRQDENGHSRSLKAWPRE